MTFFQTLKSLWDPAGDLAAEAMAAQKQDETAETSLKRLHLTLRKRLGAPSPGDTRGLFRGSGMELRNLREYQPGDEIRKMDWNVLARTGTPHIKEYYEDKQVPVWFFVDATASMGLGQRQSKLAYARELVGLLGLLAVENGYRVGLMRWEGLQTPKCIPPKSQRGQLPWLMQAIEDDAALEAGPKGFPDLAPVLQNRSLVFLLSDFAFLERLPEAASRLAALSAKHEVWSLCLVDPVERDLVYGHGWLPLGDEVSHRVAWVNTSDRWTIKEYRQLFRQQLRERERQVSSWSRFYTVPTEISPLQNVLRLMPGGMA